MIAPLLDSNGAWLFRRRTQGRNYVARSWLKSLEKEVTEGKRRMKGFVFQILKDSVRGGKGWAGEGFNPRSPFQLAYLNNFTRPPLKFDSFDPKTP